VKLHLGQETTYRKGYLKDGCCEWGQYEPLGLSSVIIAARGLSGEGVKS